MMLFNIFLAVLSCGATEGADADGCCADTGGSDGGGVCSATGGASVTGIGAGAASLSLMMR